MTDSKTIQDFWKTVKDKPNVIGFSGKLQPKITGGATDPNTRVVRIYVTKKVPKSTLRPKDLIPISAAGVATDVVEIGVIKALGCYRTEIPPTPLASDGRQDKHRPLVIGPTAMGVWEGCTACTLGGFAINKKAGEDEFVGILANNHCCAEENKAPVGTHYIQPSKYDKGKDPDDKVGTLVRFVEIKFNDFTCAYRNFFHRLWRAFQPLTQGNNVDIGFVKLDDGIPYINEIHNVGPLHGKRDAVEGDVVAKFGRTTGFTQDGIVTDTAWSGSVRYSRGIVFFQDCVLVSSDGFCAGGDSSSMVFAYEGTDPLTSTNREYIGNLFAGSDTVAIICKGSNVESRLEVEVLIGTT